MPLPQSVRIETVQGPAGTVFLEVAWTPPGLNEHRLIIGSSKNADSTDLVAAQSSLHNLLLHVYEQGRADAALGF